MTKALESVIVETSPNSKFSVIWLHGLGADGYDFVPVVRELNGLGIPPTRFIFPHAPQIPVSINGGMVMPAWYDIKNVDLMRQEDETGLRQSQQQIEQLIATEKKLGRSSKQIAIAGFSQGGAITYQTGLRHAEPLAGLIGLSTYLPLITTVDAERNSANAKTPIFAAHGDTDGVVQLSRGKTSADTLIELGYPVQWHTYPMQHSVSGEEIQDIAVFLKKIFA
jgi:phospholipase/carboxylesterase